MVFPICISDTLLCVISVDRYIYVVHNNYYRRTVTKPFLTITSVWVIFFGDLITSVWAAFDVLFRARLDTTKVAKLCFAMTVYMRIMLAISVTLCAALLRKVKQATKKSSLHQGFKFNKDNRSYCSYRGGELLSINGILKCLGI